MSLQPLRKSLYERFWAKVVQTEGCWKWIGASHSAGYGLLGRGRRGEGLIRATHVSWEIHNGPIPDGMLVLHHCDNPECCRPDHLYLGTHKENMADCLRRGRARRNPNYGLANHKAKLSDQDMETIKELWQDAPRRRHGRVALRNQIAAQFSVSDTTVKAVISGTARRMRPTIATE